MRKLMTWMFAVLAAAVALPAAAQTPAPVAAAPAAAPDPARLAEARKLVALLMSDEALNKMMGGLDKALSGQVITSMIPAGDLAKARAADPYFDERMKRVMQVSMKMTRDLMAEIAPEMREFMAAAYARNEPLDQIQQQVAFMRKPAGRSMYETMYSLMADPEYAAFMGKFMQRFGSRMPSMVEDLKKATADLPPPPKPAASK